jgi:DNA-binding GntR family transcriptional regulator
MEKRHSTGAQRVYAALRHAIITLEIDPGEPLEEERLCREYRVSRTPLREALIRLASDGLIELEPNKGARVAALQLVDVIDHYEAMDVFQPAIWHFACVRRTDADVVAIKKSIELFGKAISRQKAEDIIQTNYNTHHAIAAASHNKSLESAYRQMLVDKLRIAQHAARDLMRDRGKILAKRLTGALKIIERLFGAITRGDGKKAQALAREYNAHVRKQMVGILSASIAEQVSFKPPLSTKSSGSGSRV